MGKQYTTAPLLVNSQGDPIPQVLDPNDKTDSPEGTFKPLTGGHLQEQLTNTDATDGVVTFSENIQEIEIYNRDSTDGTFTVNSMNILVPAGEVFQAKIGGTPSKNITIENSSSYVIGRYA